MGPLAATAVVAFAGVAPAGPAPVNTPLPVDPGTELVAHVAETQHVVPLQGNAFGDLSYSLPTLPVGQPGTSFDPVDNHLTDNHHVAATEPVGPFRGNPTPDPRQADAPPPPEPHQLLWLAAFGSLATSGIVTVRWRMTARSG